MNPPCAGALIRFGMDPTLDPWQFLVNLIDRYMKFHQRQGQGYRYPASTILRPVFHDGIRFTTAAVPGLGTRPRSARSLICSRMARPGQGHIQRQKQYQGQWASRLWLFHQLNVAQAARPWRLLCHPKAFHPLLRSPYPTVLICSLSFLSAARIRPRCHSERREESRGK